MTRKIEQKSSDSNSSDSNILKETKYNQENRKKQRGTLHKNYREIVIEMTDGTKFSTKSTYRNDTLKLDVDKNTHPAWLKGDVDLDRDPMGPAAAFKKKYGGFSIGSFINKSDKGSK